MYEAENALVSQQAFIKSLVFLNSLKSANLEELIHESIN